MKKRRETAPFYISGPGVLQCRSQDLVQTEAFRRQFRALKSLTERGGSVLGVDFSKLKKEQ